MGDVTELPRKSGPGIGHRPRKRATATTTATADDFRSSDEVTNLTALKNRLAEMLARPDIHERDFSAITKDYMRVIVELDAATARANATTLGRRPGQRGADRSFTDAI
jgi:hypothetical protein